MRTWGAVLAVEAVLLAAGAVTIALIVASPFSSSSAEDEDLVLSGAAPGARAFEVTIRDKTPSPTPSPVPTPDSLRCGPTVDGAYMANTQIVSYYGNPYASQMGILGELDPATLVAEVTAHAATYDSLNGPLAARPALHIVYGTAQAGPGPEGLYLQYVDDATMREYIDLACDNGLLVFVDLQIGRSDVETEVRKVLDYLKFPNVHLALDPEFAMAPGEVPGQRIGTIDAQDVNDAQSVVEGLIEEHGLSDKIIVVHQFLEKMVTRPELIRDYPRVRLVIDMDGFGPAAIKRVKYGWFAEPAEYAGIKLFFKHDPDLMSEADVLALGPNVIIYQ
ncbi:MAG: hypothetical protein IH957_05935 [Chloroflexi bacterium]|nr:hypothetical protein [Chloroflexota bacterium]